MPSPQPRVAITGAAGFVGRHLCQWLTQRGYGVRGASRGQTTPSIPGLEFVRIDEPADKAGFLKVFAGTQAAVHLAGRAHVMQDRITNPEQAYRAANVDLTRCALEAAAEAGCRVFILASSVKAVGEASESPWTEETPPHPVDAYGKSKLEAEQLVSAEGDRLGIATVILRCPLMYGPGMRANMLRLFRAIDRGIPLPFASIKNRRSLLYVGNACAAIEQAVVTSLERPGLFNVSDGHDVSTPELVRAIGGALGRRARLFAVPTAVLQLAGTLSDGLARIRGLNLSSSAARRLLGSLQLDISRIRALLGYTPAFTFEEGMRLTAKWFRTFDRNRS